MADQPGLLSDKPVVFGVRANPKPEHSIGSFLTDGAMVQTNADGPERTSLLEVERWVPRVGFQQAKGSVGELLDGFGESSVAGPKVRRGTVIHNLVERPAA